MQKSKNFYLRVNGEVEDAILSMPQLPNAAAIRPSLILGERGEQRITESIGVMILRAMRPIIRGLLAKYRPIHAHRVAYEMINLQVF